MKTFAIVIGTITLAVVLVIVGFLAGSVWRQGRWSPNVMGYGMTGTSAQDMPCIDGEPGYGMMGPTGMGPMTMGPGMMGGNWKRNATPLGSDQNMPCGAGYVVPGGGDISSLEDVEMAAHEYVDRLGYGGLEVTEVMEFERNYYAIVAEEDTGVGAMELLVDKETGAVGPEPGPNMMWNAEYGMMGRRSGMMGMMGGYSSGVMTLSAQEAEDVAQRWLDANLPGRTAGEADEFYGYYTLHFLNDGQIEGMLSVHGSSGDVWYHSWHGDFVSMMEGHS